jgi:fumarate hydratase class I
MFEYKIYTICKSVKLSPRVLVSRTTRRYAIAESTTVKDADLGRILHSPLDGISWRKIADTGMRSERLGGHDRLVVEPATIRSLVASAFREVSHFLHESHLRQLSQILDDPEASRNDRFVALDLLKNAAVAAGGQLPMCQDTGTAIVLAERGHHVETDGFDARYVAEGVRDAFTTANLRYSQLAPLTMWEEKNTGDNLPAEISIEMAPGSNYDFLFLAKGGGSANKTFLYQETKELLDRTRFLDFVADKLRSIGTAACPPYHLAIVVGGTSADFAVKTAKLAAARDLDELPRAGTPHGTGFRDVELEQAVLTLTQELGIGAQFGGKYFCHDVRVVRLPRHTGSLPVAIAVSCSADRQIRGRITADGAFLQQLDHEPARHIPDEAALPVDSGDPAVDIDLDGGMSGTLAALRGLPVGARVSLSGTLVVARDLAHAEIRGRIRSGGEMPSYLRDHPVYYAGPAKTPEGMASGSFGPTTAARMDGYVAEFQALGGSLVMLAKGNRSASVAASCRDNGGVYLGTVGGPAALIAQDCIRSVDKIDLDHLGMEAVFAIRVENFPAFVLIDSQGNDFFARTARPSLHLGPTRTKEAR